MDRPILALVGEAGEREAVIPESKWGRAFGGTGGTRVHIHIKAVDPGALIDLLSRHGDTIAGSSTAGSGSIGVVTDAAVVYFPTAVLGATL